MNSNALQGTCPECFDTGTACSHCLPASPFVVVGNDHYTLSPAIADAHDHRLRTCPACVEFGTICRPCRKAQYEARQRLRVLKRLRVVFWIVGIAALLLLAQRQLDRSCAPGHWDAERWACRGK